MSNTRFLRNKDLIDQRQLNLITVVGAGGIGSAVIQLLAVMGFKRIHIYDPDNMDHHNLSTTLYPASQVGSPKVLAASALARQYNPAITTVASRYKFDSNQEMTPKIIVCIDNMEDRLAIYDRWRMENKDSKGYFIDGRMDALAFEVVTMTKRDAPIDYYEHWTSSANIEDAPCTMKHTIFTANLVAGMMVNQVFCLSGNRGYHKYIWMDLLTNNLRKEGFRINSIGKYLDHTYINPAITEEK
tara:strand:+ start:3726 stop:4454 length:729 start_codon:yes stop_codon:yes gene_type:complete